LCRDWDGRSCRGEREWWWWLGVGGRRFGGGLGRIVVLVGVVLLVGLGVFDGLVARRRREGGRVVCS
jgi:hypothetical protein